MRIWSGRESGVLTGQLALRAHFLLSGIPKFRLEGGRESLLTGPKCDLSDDEKAMFQGVGCPCELIICLLAVPKSDLSEDEKAMFQGVDWSFELIFCFLAGPQCDLREVEKAMFHGVDWGCETFFCILAVPKCDLG
jgi:hypothetical protein